MPFMMTKQSKIQSKEEREIREKYNSKGQCRKK